MAGCVGLSLLCGVLGRFMTQNGAFLNPAPKPVLPSRLLELSETQRVTRNEVINLLFISIQRKHGYVLKLTINLRKINLIHLKNNYVLHRHPSCQ